MSITRDEEGFIVRRTLIGTAEDYNLAEKRIMDMKSRLKKNRTIHKFEEKISIKLSRMGSEAKERFRDDLMARIKTPGGFDKLKEFSSANIR